VLSWRAFPSVPALRSTNSAADPSALFVGFPATIVEPGHAVRVVILAEVRGIAGDDHGARLRQLDQQAVMARRVPGRVEHDYAAVAEHVLVVHERLDLVLALGPALEWLVLFQRIRSYSRSGARGPSIFRPAPARLPTKKGRSL
jgi:hypothetical protein